MFKHTYLEKGMWRGWFKNGQSLEISWPHPGRLRGWGLACEVLVHSNDMDLGDCMLHLGLGPVAAYIPITILKGRYQVGEEPAWGFSLSKEFGLYVKWGRRRKFIKPFQFEVLKQEYISAATGAWEEEDRSGDWKTVLAWRDKAQAMRTHYTYALRNGTVQTPTATYRVRRWTRGRKHLRKIGWPKKVETFIDIEFDQEVGERAGSWKGGCVGCSYAMLPGEHPHDALRRMERERKFT